MGKSRRQPVQKDWCRCFDDGIEEAAEFMTIYYMTTLPKLTANDGHVAQMLHPHNVKS